MELSNWIYLPEDLFLRIFQDDVPRDFKLLVQLLRICQSWRLHARKIIQEPGFYIYAAKTEIHLHLPLFPDIKIMDLRSRMISYNDFYNLRYVERLCLAGKFNIVLLEFQTCIRCLDNIQYLDLKNTNISMWCFLNDRSLGKFSKLKVIVESFIESLLYDMVDGVKILCDPPENWQTCPISEM